MSPTFFAADGIDSIQRLAAIHSALGDRSIVLIGMMGAGKSSIGRRLAVELNLPFFDADLEIEKAAGKTIEEIFEEHGEGYFREGEERVIKRLLQGGQQVLATGGGAVLRQATREAIATHAITIWLDAPLDLLMNRVLRRDHRPLLRVENPRAIMARLASEREPYYRAMADLTFEAEDAPHDMTVNSVLVLLDRYALQKSAVVR